MLSALPADGVRLILVNHVTWKVSGLISQFNQ